MTTVTIDIDGDPTAVGQRIGQEIVLPLITEAIAEIKPADRLRLYAGLLATLTGALQGHLGPQTAQALMHLLLRGLAQIEADQTQARH